MNRTFLTEISPRVDLRRRTTAKYPNWFRVIICGCVAAVTLSASYSAHAQDRDKEAHIANSVARANSLLNWWCGIQLDVKFRPDRVGVNIQAHDSVAHKIKVTAADPPDPELPANAMITIGSNSQTISAVFQEKQVGDPVPLSVLAGPNRELEANFYPPPDWSHPTPLSVTTGPEGSIDALFLNFTHGLTPAPVSARIMGDESIDFFIDAEQLHKMSFRDLDGRRWKLVPTR
ncbi:MAG TPA: hypothetical protein PKD64_12610 [Pirellulaceae bacterium]|nr:hypothetical protein [Pirellulaceae bacterium]HMO93029.1 hypothetical protein [Pirellulaceae bacterium]HMP69659.1 hypothetical protein [Pirellulaceae bacterium]